jgi:cytidylate kinase
VDDEGALCSLASRSRITLQPSADGNRVLLDTIDVSNRVREKDVTQAASRVSVHPRVRTWMVQQQRQLGAERGVVMEGRDIGTAVFPDADIKIFLDAAPEVRGNRRYRQTFSTSAPSVSPQTDDVSEKALLEEMRERDRRDRSRTTSPLVPASDAIIIDSTEMTLEQVIARAEAIIDQHLGR